MSMVKKIPGTVITKINQKIGFRFLTKFGSKGLINFLTSEKVSRLLEESSVENSIL